MISEQHILLIFFFFLSSINSKGEEHSVGTLATKQQQLKKKKKQVFFEDGLYPNCNSSDEDRQAVDEQLLIKVRRLRKRYKDEPGKIASFIKDPLSEDEIDAELAMLPPPTPPAGMPPLHVEQPSYLRPISPDTYVFFHYDPMVSSMFVSAHEHALPPRLLDPKKTTPASGAVAELMMSFMPRPQNHLVNQLPSTTAPAYAAKPQDSLSSMPPLKINNKNISVSAVPSPNNNVAQQPVITANGIKASSSSSSLSARNEFVTQPLYPTARSSPIPQFGSMPPKVPPPGMGRIPHLKPHTARSSPPIHMSYKAPPPGMSPMAGLTPKSRHNHINKPHTTTIQSSSPMHLYENMPLKGTQPGISSSMASFNAISHNTPVIKPLTD